MDILSEVRKRSREEWEQYGKSQLRAGRIWLQEHGEHAFLIGAGVGVLLVAAPALIFWLLMIGALLCIAVWFLSVPEAEKLAPRDSGVYEFTHRKDDEKKDDFH